MNKIPPKLQEEMAQDKFYKRCCFESFRCAGKIEWHHVLTFAGKQLQKKFAIIPVCADYHHRYADQHDIREKMLYLVLNRATDTELKDISKAIDYIALRDRLNIKYGEYREGNTKGGLGHPVPKKDIPLSQ